jgi:hypothetical protein
MKFPGHVIKIGESDKTLVRRIAERLTALGYKPKSPSGVFDAAFKSLVKLFQTQHVDALGVPLKADGEIGPLSWGALFEDNTGVAPASGGTLRDRALKKAISQIGIREKPVGSNRGPEVEDYLRSVNLGGGYFWCMAFVHYCFREAAKEMGIANPFPKTAGCIDAWSKASSFRISKQKAAENPGLVVPGSVFILDYGNGHGHTGIVRNCVGGSLRTVEGNTNSDGSSNGIGVFELARRNVMNPSLKGFIIVP